MTPQYGLPYFGNRSALFSDLLGNLGNLSFNTIYDPFSGSGAVSHLLMSNDIAKQYVLNDKSKILPQLFTQLRENPNALLAFVLNLQTSLITAATVDEAQSIFDYYLNLYNEGVGSTLKQVALFYVCMVYATNHTPIFSQSGTLVSEFNREFNSKYFDIPSNIQTFAKQLQCHKVRITSQDFAKVIEDATSRDLVVLDPPYPDNVESKDRFVYEQHDKQSKSSLHVALESSIAELCRNDIPWIMFLGTGDVPEKYILKSSDEFKHFVRLDSHADYGDYIEHVYMHHRIASQLEVLPDNMAVYNRDEHCSNKKGVAFFRTKKLESKPEMKM